jgi:hypothetical protein
MKADVLLGLQWGDEGKGKVVDILTQNMILLQGIRADPMPDIRWSLTGSNMFYIPFLPEFFIPA